MSNTIFTSPAQTVSISFHAVRIGKEEEMQKKWNDEAFEGIKIEEFKDRDGKERIKRAPVAVKVAEFGWSETRIKQLTDSATRSVIKSALEECHFDEVAADELEQLLDAEQSSGGTGGVALSKEERAELMELYNQHLIGLEVPESGREVHKAVLYYAASDSKMKSLGDWNNAKERVQAACKAVADRLNVFLEEVEGLEAAYVASIIERVKNYSEKGPAPKAKREPKDVLEML